MTALRAATAILVWAVATGTILWLACVVVALWWAQVGGKRR